MKLLEELPSKTRRPGKSTDRRLVRTWKRIIVKIAVGMTIFHGLAATGTARIVQTSRITNRVARRSRRGRQKVKRELFPTIIGGGLPKIGIGIKSRRLSGFDVFITDQENKHVYAWLNFSTKEGIDRLIGLLQETKTIMEKEEGKE